MSDLKLLKCKYPDLIKVFNKISINPDKYEIGDYSKTKLSIEDFKKNLKNGEIWYRNNMLNGCYFQYHDGKYYLIDYGNSDHYSISEIFSTSEIMKQSFITNSDENWYKIVPKKYNPKSTQYLFDCSPKEFLGLEYLDAILYKKEKAKLLSYKLVKVANMRDETRMNKVKKAFDNCIVLINQATQKTSEY